MKTFVYTLNLKDDPGIIRKYKEYHRAVWPEVEESLKSVGITSMRIFLLGRRLVNVVEAIDEFVPERDFARYTQGKPKAQQWDQMMVEYQEKVPEAGAKEWWVLMEKIYELGT